MKSNNMKIENKNWNLAILTFVILILLFFWFYKFLFTIGPTNRNIDTGTSTDISTGIRSNIIAATATNNV
jgi:hypothetical protein